MVKIGDKVRFDHLKDIKIRGMASGQEFVTGKVIEVYPDKRWFAVEYSLKNDDTRLRTSFHFADIDVNVTLCK